VSCGRLSGEPRIRNYLNGSGRGIIEVMSRYLGGGTKKEHGKSAQQVFRQRFEQSTFKTQG
jgi:hypothetical protein